MRICIVSLILLSCVMMSCDSNISNSAPEQNKMDKVASTDNSEQQTKSVGVTENVTAQQGTQQHSQPFPSTSDVNEIFAVDENDVIIGNPDAKIVMIEYSSPTCAHCAFFHKSIFPEIKKNYIDSGKVAYVLRQFITNKQDLDATILAWCGKRDNIVTMIDIFLSQQSSWAFNANYRDILTNIGQLSGISKEEYSKCLLDESLIDRLIGRSRAVMRVPKFIGTPSFIINGQLYSKAYTYQNLSEEIELALVNDNKSDSHEKVLLQN